MNNKSFFDDDGRCIPSDIKTEVHYKTRRYFRLNPPVIDLSKIYQSISTRLGKPKKLSQESFISGIQKILTSLKNDSTTSNITKGVGLPFFIPQMAISDMGKAISDSFIPALSGAYLERFPNADFVNHHKESLSNTLSISSESRHEKILERLKTEDVYGVYFPCLTEYSLPATREIMTDLDKQFLLAGGVDTLAAVIGTPDLLRSGDAYPPLLWLAALDIGNDEENYHLETYGENLTFNRRRHHGSVAECWGAGLTVLG
jgi:hypothetical protein